MSPEHILGLPFFHGSVAEAVERALGHPGLVVAPSGTCFERFVHDAEYRRAVLTADLVLPDSGAMVALWQTRTGRVLHRISGLAYLKALLARLIARAEMPDVFWVLPHAKARDKLLAWLAAGGTAAVPSKTAVPSRTALPSRTAQADGTAPVPPDDAARSEGQIVPPSSNIYIAPHYGPAVTDPVLLERLQALRPRHIIIAIGAGAQEKLGWYLRENLRQPSPDLCPPAIHCIGGALGFVTGDQVAIPDWADRLYLGWFLRFLSQPRVFLPRLWKARLLPALLWRYGTEPPPLAQEHEG